MSSLLGPILPEELTWSYFSRLNVRYAVFTDEELGHLLDGHAPSYRKALPTRLAALARIFRYRGAPDAGSIIRGHTFFPFARPVITAAEAGRFEESLAESSFPVNAPEDLTHATGFRLRVCPKCLEHDLKT
jgi:hypothetical protein